MIACAFTKSTKLISSTKKKLIDRKSRKISFRKRLHVVLIERKNELSQEMKNSIWYNKGEYEMFKKEAYNELNVKISVPKILVKDDQNISCQRGLENLVNFASFYKHRRRIFSVTNAVINEQHWQRQNNKQSLLQDLCSQMLIAGTSMMETEICKYEALVRGVKDAHDVK